jgi:excisionase family DNA binding protein
VTPLLTIADAAAILRISPDSVRRHAKAGKIPARKQGRRFFFTESDLAAYLEASRYQVDEPVRVERRVAAVPQLKWIKTREERARRA